MNKSNIVHVGSIESEPFKNLFLKFIETQDTDSLQSKSETLAKFLKACEELENCGDNQQTILFWTSIGSTFSTYSCCAVLGAVNPIIGGLLAIGGISGAIGVIASSWQRKQKLAPIQSELKRYTLAMLCHKMLEWACIWEVVGVSKFLDSLYYAAKGSVTATGKFEHVKNNRTPLDVATHWLAGQSHLTVPELVQQFRDVKVGELQDTKSSQLLNTKSSELQDTKSSRGELFSLAESPTVIQTESPTVIQAESPTVIQAESPTVIQAESPTVIQNTKKTKIDSEQIRTDSNWIKGFLSSTALVWGGQGSGKSWFVRHLVKLKVEFGYRVIVFDPNSNRSEWFGVELVNSYPEIEKMMRWYVGEVMQRYETFGNSEMSEEDWRSQLWQNNQTVTVICEEMTTYSDFIEDTELLTKFFKVAATLSRKQEMPCIFVSHNNTQGCLLDVKGLHQTINRLQQIQLLATTDPTTSQPVSSGQGLIKLDGSDTWSRVQLPHIAFKITQFRELNDTPVPKVSEQPTTLQLDAKSMLERLYQLPAVDEPKIIKPTDKLSDRAKTVLEIISSSDKEYLGFHAIRNSRKWDGNNPHTGELRELIQKLISGEFIAGDEEQGYTFT